MADNHLHAYAKFQEDPIMYAIMCQLNLRQTRAFDIIYISTQTSLFRLATIQSSVRNLDRQWLKNGVSVRLQASKKRHRELTARTNLQTE